MKQDRHKSRRHRSTDKRAADNKAGQPEKAACNLPDGPSRFKACLEGHVVVSRESLQRLEIYAELLTKWQKAQNLVAPNSLDHLWVRHFADSAQLLAHLHNIRSLADLGSGAGFPGLVLALLQPEGYDFTTHLIEANGRKCAFLKDVVRNTGANVEIHNCRIEDFANQSTIPDIDVVTARALKPLKVLLQLGWFAFERGAFGLFLKGSGATEEINDARRQWDYEATCFKSLTHQDACVIQLMNIQPRR